MKKIYYILIVIFVAASCTQKQTQVKHNPFAPSVVEGHGYVVPMDSMSKPKVILVDVTKIKKIPVGKPKVILTNTNVHSAVRTNIQKAGIPKKCSPGKESFLLPKKRFVKTKSAVTGIPEVMIAKDPHINDINSQSFSTYGKLQGLKHDIVRCMLQDKNGNLWFGTYGGVSKYDGKSFTHFTDKEGLRSNTVFSILEDKKGDLWFGTDDGLTRYDGKCFTHFEYKKGAHSNSVISILEDKKGNIWFGSNDGLTKYDGDYFTHFTVKEGLIDNTVYCIFEDKSGNLWLGTNGGISNYNGKYFTNFTETEGLSSNTVYSIFEDKSGNFWFGTDGGGVNKYDGTYFTYFTDKEGLSNSTVMSVFEDKRGNLWFGTYGGGVNKFDGKTFTHFTDKEGLSNNTVYQVLEDRSGNLWYGTDRGVSKYDGKSFNHFTDKEGLSNNTVYSILEDDMGNLWIGTDGGGVNKYDGKSFSHYTDKEGLSNNSVMSILEDKTGNLWFGTDGGGVNRYDGNYFTCFTDENGLSNNAIYSILEDKSGNIWFGTNGGVNKYDGKSFTQYTEKEGLGNNSVYSIIEDKKGDLWFGTYGGVTRYDGKSFTRYTDKEGLSNNIVRSIIEDRNGNLWFGSYGGISKYDGKFFTHFTDKEGLSNNAVLSMLEDRVGNLWFGTRFGLSGLSVQNVRKITNVEKLNKIQEGELLFKNYSFEDGFYGIGCNGGNSGKNICEDKKGTIWIGANDRLTAFHPKGEMVDSNPPNIQLTSITLFNENIPWINLAHKKDTSFLLGNGVKVGDFQFDDVTKWYWLPKKLSLANNNNYLTFNFIGITQKQNNKVKYQYKLEGMDENWSALTLRTEISYGNLPQGFYTFKVRAMNSEGFWSKTFNYSFTIRPPWWKMWWFRSLVFGFLVIGVWLLFKWRIAALRRDKELLEHTVKIRTHELAEKTILAEENEKDALQQKEEAEKQKRIAENQKKVVEEQKQLVDEKQKEILDSIHYASRIQKALLTGEEYIREHFKAEHFILFKPKDIVAGDFYWALNHHNLFYIATCDCTGHGVPGAFMSMLNISFLNENVVERQLKMPDEILNSQREQIIKALNTKGNDNNDGMDCVLCAFDEKNMLLHFAAAYNKIIIIRNGEMMEFQGDKMSVGKHILDHELFTLQTIQLQKGDTIYTYTDGYVDQFGESNKKLKSKVLKEILLQINYLPMLEQKDYLDNFIENWKGNLDQTDDILVIGIRL